MKEQPQPAGPCSPRLGEGRCVPLDGAPRVEAVNPLAPLGALHRRHVEIAQRARVVVRRSEEHTSELQSLMRISYAVFCLQKKKQKTTQHNPLVIHIRTL